MNKEFVPYEQALALKELGFDEDCLGRYEGKIKSIFKPLVLEFTFANLPRVENKVNYPNYPYQDVEAPLYQQAFRWFREKYKLHSKIDIQDVELNFYCYDILEVKEGRYNNDLHIDMNFKSYEEAELACLKQLIKIVKNEKHI